MEPFPFLERLSVIVPGSHSCAKHESCSTVGKKCVTRVDTPSHPSGRSWIRPTSVGHRLEPLGTPGL